MPAVGRSSCQPRNENFPNRYREALYETSSARALGPCGRFAHHGRLVARSGHTHRREPEQHVVADHRGHRPRRPDTHCDLRRLGRIHTDFLRLPVAELQLLRERLLGDQQGYEPELRDLARGRQPHDSRPGDGLERRRLQPGAVCRNRDGHVRVGHRSGEHEAAGPVRHGKGRPDGEDEQRRLVGSEPDHVHLSVAELRRHGLDLLGHRRRDRPELHGRLRPRSDRSSVRRSPPRTRSASRPPSRT